MNIPIITSNNRKLSQNQCLFLRNTRSGRMGKVFAHEEQDIH